MTSEKNTVDRAIEIEDEMNLINRKMEHIEEEMANWTHGGLTWSRLAEVLEELEIKLLDLQEEYRG